MLCTAVQRANEILPALTYCFFCMRCRQNIGMHEWFKLLRKACMFCFRCFRDRTYSYDEYFCILVPGMYAIVLYTCVSHVLLLLLVSHINSCQKSRVRGHTKVLEP